MEAIGAIDNIAFRAPTTGNVVGAIFCLIFQVIANRKFDHFLYQIKLDPFCPLGTDN